MAIHITASFTGNIRITNHAISLATGHKKIDSSANVIAILAFTNGTAFHEHGHAAKGCHGDGVLPTCSFPMAIFMLVARHPSEAFFDGVLVFFGDFIAL